METTKTKVPEVRWTLAIETSVLTSSVALLDGEVVQAESTVKTARGHASRLLPMVESVLETAGITTADLDLIVVPLGPGSFTGIRIGLSTAKGLAWALKIPAVGICSLEILARGSGIQNTPIVSVLDARKGEVFLGIYRVDSAGELEVILPPMVSKPLEALECVEGALSGTEALYVGEGVRAYPDVFRNQTLLPHLFDVIRGSVSASAGRALFLEKGNAEPQDLQPIYLRRSDAEIQMGLPTGTREMVFLQ